MPIYQRAAPHGLLTGDMKALIATAITDAHVDATGAPRVFVHVFFNELTVHVFFNELPPGVAYSASWSEITGQPQKRVVAGLTEIDSDVTMEYGLVLPHPGDETAWFAENADALDGIQGTGL
ncbi:MAG TPA: tautomerase family protein [Gaiellales bacterium]|nr:tautomerase family protein [Gaiellales bacterium]